MFSNYMFQNKEFTPKNFKTLINTFKPHASKEGVKHGQLLPAWNYIGKKNTSSNKTSKLVLSNLLICFFVSEEENITLSFAWDWKLWICPWLIMAMIMMTTMHLISQAMRQHLQQLAPPVSRQQQHFTRT